MTRSNLHTHWHEVVTEDDAFEVRISYTALPGSPAVLWGDSPYPGDDPEFEIVRVDVQNGDAWVAFTLSAADEDAALTWIAENHDFHDGSPDPDDVRDRMIDDMLTEVRL